MSTTTDNLPSSLAVLCKLQFVCEQRWEDLRPIPGNDSVRHCSLCQEAVHWCEDHASFRKHAKAGHCVALPGRDPNGGMWVGGAGMPYDLDAEQDAKP